MGTSTPQLERVWRMKDSFEGQDTSFQSLLLHTVACRAFNPCPVPAPRTVSQAQPSVSIGAEMGLGKAPAHLG